MYVVVCVVCACDMCLCSGVCVSFCVRVVLVWGLCVWLVVCVRGCGCVCLLCVWWVCVCAVCVRVCGCLCMCFMCLCVFEFYVSDGYV